MTTDERIILEAEVAGYSREQALAGLAYADSRGLTQPTERLSATFSRILYDDAALADGAWFQCGFITNDDGSVGAPSPGYP